MRIFVVDDEKPLADTLVLILRTMGYEATAAYDGATALSHSELSLPDVVICDVIMPGMDGIAVCRRIQASHPSCHIILFSGQAATNVPIRDSRNQGCSWELLAKPVDPEELLAKLASIKSDL
jgi:CheY-like chemotaxis protein